jgi:hypothetical protein
VSASADRTICSGLAVLFSMLGIGEAFVWFMNSDLFGFALTNPIGIGCGIVAGVLAAWALGWVLALQLVRGGVLRAAMWGAFLGVAVLVIAVAIGAMASAGSPVAAYLDDLGVSRSVAVPVRLALRWGGLAAAATGALFGVASRWAHAREASGLSW